jgi:hypothetical protein
VPSLSNGLTVEVVQPVSPSVERPVSTSSASVVPVVGPKGDTGDGGTPDLTEVLNALEPPVALDVLYVNGTI